MKRITLLVMLILPIMGQARDIKVQTSTKCPVDCNVGDTISLYYFEGADIKDNNNSLLEPFKSHFYTAVDSDDQGRKYGWYRFNVKAPGNATLRMCTDDACCQLKFCIINVTNESKWK